MKYIWGDDRRFNSYKRFLHNRFGGRIQKLTLDAGFTCPNRDGSVGTGGCTYCLNDAFNPSYCQPEKSIAQQLEEGIDFHRNRYRRAEQYLAYFQAYSNTYAPIDQLKEIYRPALENPLIKGLVIGTRPDCIDEEKLNYFTKLSEQLFVSIEYGVESCNNHTLKRINRGHSFEQAVETIKLTAARGIHTGAHFIFGLPGETPKDFFEQINIINSLPLNGIKFHQLQIIKGTRMEHEYFENPNDFHHFTLDLYIEFIITYLELLNPNFVVERFAGEVPPRYLSFNNWGTIRYDVILQKIEKALEEKNSYQGMKYSS